MNTLERTVTWGDALLVKAVRAPGGLNQTVDRIRRVIGPSIGTRNSFAKLYNTTDPATLNERDQFRAWVLLTALGEEPAGWSVYNDAIPEFYTTDIARLQESLVHPPGLEPGTQ